MNSDLTRFNNQMTQLLNFLKTIECLEKDKAISLFEIKYNGIKSMDSKKPLECFLKFVYPYKRYIMDRDNDFFLKDIKQKVNKLTDDAQDEDVLFDDIKDDEFVLHQALNIKRFWENELTEGQKKMIWTYFQVLIKLTERYVASKLSLSEVMRL